MKTPQTDRIKLMHMVASASMNPSITRIQPTTTPRIERRVVTRGLPQAGQCVGVWACRLIVSYRVDGGRINGFDTSSLVV